MSAFSTPQSDPRPVAGAHIAPRRVAMVRAALALAWAAAVILAARGHEPATAAGVMTGVAALLVSYPLIDVGASLVNAAVDAASRRVLWINAAIGLAAVAALAIAGFGSDAGATMTTFGVWASASGAIQLGIAVRRRRAHGGELPMIVSGGLSTLAGINFIAQSGGHSAHLVNIGGYMALGAVLFLVWSVRNRVRPAASR